MGTLNHKARCLFQTHAPLVQEEQNPPNIWNLSIHAEYGNALAAAFTCRFSETQ